MKLNFLAFPILAMTLASGVVFAQKTTVPTTHADSLKAVVAQYYQLNIAVFQSGSTQKQIDAVFALFTEGFEYIHPKYGGTYTREDLYNGYVRNQNNGNYNGRVKDIVVVQSIIGLNAVCVVKKFVIQENGVTEEGEAEMTLFEFENGKIAKIKEYW